MQMRISASKPPNFQTSKLPNFQLTGKVNEGVVTANTIIEDARVARVRELKTALAAAKERLAQVEDERDSLLAHLDLALVALHDFEQLGEEAQLQIIDGWNAILRHRNVSKLTSEDISKLKADYLAGLGIVPPESAVSAKPSCQTLDQRLNPQPATNEGFGVAGPTPPTLNVQHLIRIWIVFDGSEENSYRSGAYRVTYTGGTGPHRADRLILDYVHAVRTLGLDTSRITVDTADKALAKKLDTLGAKVFLPNEGSKGAPTLLDNR
jgi:hypothetical protein